MRKIFTTLLLAASLFATAGSPKDIIPPSTDFDVADCGEVVYQHPVSVIFRIDNNDPSVPLTITRIETACNCLITRYTDPLSGHVIEQSAPDANDGKKAKKEKKKKKKDKQKMKVSKKYIEIEVTFDAEQMGHFEKYVDVWTSQTDAPFQFTIKGVVINPNWKK